jgi:hypothetical protein
MHFWVFASAMAAVAAQMTAAPPVFFFTRFPTTSQKYRDEVQNFPLQNTHPLSIICRPRQLTSVLLLQLIGRMDNISHWSCPNEPGVKKYALVIPRGGNDTTTAYSIEQYVLLS